MASPIVEKVDPLPAAGTPSLGITLFALLGVLALTAFYYGIHDIYWDLYVLQAPVVTVGLHENPFLGQAVMGWAAKALLDIPAVFFSASFVGRFLLALALLAFLRASGMPPLASLAATVLTILGYGMPRFFYQNIAGPLVTHPGAISLLMFATALALLSRRHRFLSGLFFGLAFQFHPPFGASAFAVAGLRLVLFAEGDSVVRGMRDFFVVLLGFLFLSAPFLLNQGSGAGPNSGAVTGDILLFRDWLHFQVTLGYRDSLLIYHLFAESYLFKLLPLFLWYLAIRPRAPLSPVERWLVSVLTFLGIACFFDLLHINEISLGFLSQAIFGVQPQRATPLLGLFFVPAFVDAIRNASQPDGRGQGWVFWNGNLVATGIIGSVNYGSLGWILWGLLALQVIASRSRQLAGVISLVVGFYLFAFYLKGMLDPQLQEMLVWNWEQLRTDMQLFTLALTLLGGLAISLTLLLVPRHRQRPLTPRARMALLLVIPLSLPLAASVTGFLLHQKKVPAAPYQYAILKDRFLSHLPHSAFNISPGANALFELARFVEEQRLPPGTILQNPAADQWTFVNAYLRFPMYFSGFFDFGHATHDYRHAIDLDRRLKNLFGKGMAGYLLDGQRFHAAIGDDYDRLTLDRLLALNGETAPRYWIRSSQLPPLAIPPLYRNDHFSLYDLDPIRKERPDGS
ncbi:MAG: hypothetical protein HQL57_08560 [Magnetococcales bacterium]|nr:hypothetical protein [Magnetococcales bacterium]MBF0157219.1 hypothetical protein [Magnetococcales bacterium]